MLNARGNVRGFFHTGFETVVRLRLLEYITCIKDEFYR